MDFGMLHDMIDSSGENKAMSQTTRAYLAIRNAILELNLPSGYPILEGEIAEKLNMSRTPVREAIQRLKSEGLVETVHRKGAFVKALSSEDVRQLYEMNEGLEGMAAYLAALRADEDKLEQLAAYVSELEQALGSDSLEHWVQADEGFHKTLHSMTQNEYLTSALSNLYDQIHRVRLMTIRVLGNKDESLSDHKKTYEAIKARDADLARQITQEHWRRVRSEVLRIIP